MCVCVRVRTCVCVCISSKCAVMNGMHGPYDYRRQDKRNRRMSIFHDQVQSKLRSHLITERLSVSWSSGSRNSGRRVGHPEKRRECFAEKGNPTENDTQRKRRPFPDLTQSPVKMNEETYRYPG